MEWIPITPDNMEEIYEKMDFNRLVISFKAQDHEYTDYRMIYACSLTVSDMARIGGYYYIELPDVRKDTKEWKRDID